MTSQLKEECVFGGEVDVGMEEVESKVMGQMDQTGFRGCERWRAS